MQNKLLQKQVQSKPQRNSDHNQEDETSFDDLVAPFKRPDGQPRKMETMNIQNFQAAHINSKIKGLKLSEAKIKKAEKLSTKIAATLANKDLSETELATLQSRVDAVATDWGLPVAVLAKNPDYAQIVRLLGLAVVCLE